MSLNEPEREKTVQRIVELGPWFHQIELGSGIRTRDISPAPGPQPQDHSIARWEAVQNWIPTDLAGKRILDIGCADGFFSVELARRGATEIVAVDPWRKALEREKVSGTFCATHHSGRSDKRFLQPLSRRWRRFRDTGG